MSDEIQSYKVRNSIARTATLVTALSTGANYAMLALGYLSADVAAGLLKVNYATWGGILTAYMAVRMYETVKGYGAKRG